MERHPAIVDLQSSIVNSQSLLVAAEGRSKRFSFPIPHSQFSIPQALAGLVDHLLVARRLDPFPVTVDEEHAAALAVEVRLVG